MAPHTPHSRGRATPSSGPDADNAATAAKVLPFRSNPLTHQANLCRINQNVGHPIEDAGKSGAADAAPITDDAQRDRPIPKQHLHDVKNLSSTQLIKKYPGEHSSWLASKQRSGANFHAPWRKFASFLRDMGPKPNSAYTLDRDDPNDLRYGPGLCHWKSTKDQSINKRATVRLTDAHDRTLPLETWARIKGLDAHMMRQQRRRGWTDLEILAGRRLSGTEKGPVVAAAEAPQPEASLPSRYSELGVIAKHHRVEASRLASFDVQDVEGAATATRLADDAEREQSELRSQLGWPAQFARPPAKPPRRSAMTISQIRAIGASYRANAAPGQEPRVTPSPSCATPLYLPPWKLGDAVPFMPTLPSWENRHALAPTPWAMAQPAGPRDEPAPDDESGGVFVQFGQLVSCGDAEED